MQLFCGWPLLALLATSCWAARPPKYLIKYKGEPAAARAAVSSAGGKVTRDHATIGILVAESTNPAFAAGLSASTAIEYAAPDERFRLAPEPAPSVLQPVGAAPANIAVNPPQAARYQFRQWNLHHVQANLAWELTQGSPEVRVAVLDTGICAHHVDLQGKVDAEQSASIVPPDQECAPTVAPACDGCPDWEDRYYHGTHVAAIIASNNVGVAGVAPNVRLRAVKIANCRGESEWSWLIEGILFAADSGNDIINISFSSAFKERGVESELLIRVVSQAIVYARSRGALVVSSAGNDGLKLDHGPRVVIPCEAGAFCVGATTVSDDVAKYSNTGLTAVALMAPGGGLPLKPFERNADNEYILSACSRHSTIYPACGTGDGSFALYSNGTSQAAPLVSGAVALIDSLASPPGSATPVQLEWKLKQSADDLGKSGPDVEYSNGRLNVYRAVR